MIDFYYWGIQCPYNQTNREVLRKIQEDYDVEVNFFDLDENHELAEKYYLYSPTMTVFNKGLRWSGPLTYELVEKYLAGEKLSRRPYIVKSEKQFVQGTVKPLTSETIVDTRFLCCRKGCSQHAQEKGQWLARIMSRYPDKHLGMLHYVSDQCVGGVEYVPSLEVPYNIPKSEKYAFLTCVFASDPVYDYKSYPLTVLEEDLKDQGYEKIYAVASEKVAFPNGPLEWFLEKGYQDLGMVYLEENDHAYQHLIEKIL